MKRFVLGFFFVFLMFFYSLLEEDKYAYQVVLAWDFLLCHFDMQHIKQNTHIIWINSEVIIAEK